MAILQEFLLRLAFGLAVGMGLTTWRLVSGGFFRNHLYVTLGLTTLATLVGVSAGFVWWPAVGAAIASYWGSIYWLYERQRWGVVALWIVAAFCLLGIALNSMTILSGEVSSQLAVLLGVLGGCTSGLVLGLTTASMLLGHWYLNAPGMRLEPLRRLLVAAAAATIVHAALIAGGFWGEFAVTEELDSATGWFLALRWGFGILGTLGLLWLAWETLRIPNTQSATGILYVAVIAVFTGELAGLLLSAGSTFPL
jgi:hypothetical protein